MAPAWTTAAVLLAARAVFGSELLVRLEAYAMLLAATLRTLGIHLWLVSRGESHAWPAALAVLGLLGAACAGLAYARRHRLLARSWAADLDEQVPEILFYSTAAIGWILTFLKTPASFLTIVWSLEGLVLFGLGLLTRAGHVRLTGVGLLLFCTLRVFFYDLSGLETLPRIFSFIALGIILLLVSLLYTRLGSDRRNDPDRDGSG